MRLIAAVLIVVCLAGCQSAPKTTNLDLPAMHTMAEGLANTQVSQEDLRRLGVQMQKDPETKSAVQAVNSAFSVQDTGVKYCPKDGKRFSSRLKYCPEHKDIKLILVE